MKSTRLLDQFRSTNVHFDSPYNRFSGYLLGGGSQRGAEARGAVPYCGPKALPRGILLMKLTRLLHQFRSTNVHFDNPYNRFSGQLLAGGSQMRLKPEVPCPYCGPKALLRGIALVRTDKSDEGKRNWYTFKLPISRCEQPKSSQTNFLNRFSP